MRYGNPARIGTSAWAIGFCTACTVLSPANGADDYEVVEVPLDITQVGGAIDVTFSDANDIFVLRPNENAITKVIYDGNSINYVVWDDDDNGQPEIDGGLCAQRPSGLQTFCWECPANGGSLIYAPMTNGVSLDFAAGTLLVGRENGFLGLYTTDMELWYVCGAPVGDGLPQEISEYNVSPGSTRTFSLTFPENGLQPVNGMVVGGINTNTGFVSSRKGSGTGGGGPYPGVDSNWDSGSFATSLSSHPAVGDFNGDGWEDLVVLHPSENEARFLPFDSLSSTRVDGKPVPGGAVFGTPIPFITGFSNPLFASAGDFDNDSLLDVVIAGENGDLEIYLGDGAGAFSSGIGMSLPGTPSSLETIDLDDDGDSEVLAAGENSNLTGWLMIVWLDNGIVESQLIEFDGGIQNLAVNSFLGTANAAVARVSAENLLDRVHIFASNGPGSEEVYDDLGGIIDIDGGGAGVAVACSDGSVRLINGTADVCIPAGVSLPVSVGCGELFVVAAYADGSVEGCGVNNAGALDIPTDLEPVDQIDASRNSHVIALQNDGTVRCWGSNSSGESDVPVGLSGVTAVVAGAGHSVALKDDGTVVCWGDNWGGQCDVPIGLTDVAQIAAGYAHTVVLKNDGTVECWGEYACEGTPPDLAGVVEVAATDLNNIIRFEDGSIACYGSGGGCSFPNTIGSVKKITGTIYHVVVLDQIPDAITASLLEITPASGIPGDINNDGQVNGADLGLMLAAWGPCADPSNCPADLNGDGNVDGADLGTLLASWTG